MCLIADIGGTNARFALVDEGSTTPQHERTLSCANYRTLVDAVLAYLEDASQAMPEAASLAIATPVSNDRVVMTNHVWDLSVEETRKVLGLKSLKVLNDYTALALALPYLAKDDFRQVGDGAAVDKQTMAVLGPGTGLGVSGAICAGDYWLPLQSEGGHISYGPLIGKRMLSMLSASIITSFLQNLWCQGPAWSCSMNPLPGVTGSNMNCYLRNRSPVKH